MITNLDDLKCKVCGTRSGCGTAFDGGMICNGCSEQARADLTIQISANKQKPTGGTIAYVHEGEPNPAIDGRPIRLEGVECGYCGSAITGHEMNNGKVAIYIAPCEHCLDIAEAEGAASGYRRRYAGTVNRNDL